MFCSYCTSEECRHSTNMNIFLFLTRENIIAFFLLMQNNSLGYLLCRCYDFYGMPFLRNFFAFLKIVTIAK